MNKALLILAAIIDFGIAALLIAVSGFIFGGGPQSLPSHTLTTVLFVGAVIGCIALPITAFIVNKSGKTGLAMLIAWLPAVVGFVVLVVPSL